MKKSDLKIKLKLNRPYSKDKKKEIKTIYLPFLPRKDDWFILKDELIFIDKIYILLTPDEENHIAKISAFVFQTVDEKGKVIKCKPEKVLGF